MEKKWREGEVEAECEEDYTEGTTDSEPYLEDLNDGDDDVEDGCAYGDSIPKLQFRKEVSKAKWRDDLGMAEVVENKGQMWRTTGIVRNGKIYCLVEETLYLAHIGALHLLDGNDMPLSLKDIYIKVLPNTNRFCWDSFEVYKHLKHLGYIVGRHGIPWTVKSVKVNSDTARSALVTDERVDGESRGAACITKMFSLIAINEVRVRLVFDVYLPNSKFKKSSPGSPSSVICLTSGHPPLKQEIEELERQCNGHRLKFCSVDQGRVSFFSFNRIDLPVLL